MTGVTCASRSRLTSQAAFGGPKCRRASVPWCWVLLQPDDAVAVNARFRIPLAVAVPVYIAPVVGLIAGPVRPHIPPPAGPQLPTFFVARSYA